MDISVLFPDKTGSKHFPHNKGTRAPAGAAVGVGTGAVLGGAVGGIAGALIGMGIPEHAAKRYEVRVKEGGILLSVHSDNAEWTKRAKEILERTGAQDISVTGEGGADYLRSARPATGGGTV
jgi:outer membrane lipoprotein SlyB